MAEAKGVDERQAQEQLAARLREMGLEVTLQSGGLHLVGRLLLGGEPLPSPSGPLGLASLVFATAGSHHIKCLRPRPLFQLPLVSIAGCGEASEIEGRVRAAWIDHMARLRRAEELLAEADVEPTWEAHHAGLAFSLDLGARADRARVLRARLVAVPTAGPLADRAVRRAADRVADWPADAASGAEVAISVTTHMEGVAQEIDQQEASSRRQRWCEAESGPEQPLHPFFRGRDHPVLLVGPRLLAEVELHTALRRRGFRPGLARTPNEARRSFDRTSFEAVLTDAILDRAEGLELIPTLADVPGIGRLPVVLVDDRARESRREAARTLGAAGYLVRPLDPERLAAGLERLIAQSPRRRFERFAQRLGLSWDDGASGVTTVVGRLGMFVSTERPSEAGCLETVELSLPERATSIRMDVETLYRVEAAGARDPGIGVRIRSFPDGDETLWIGYLNELLTPRRAEGASRPR